MLDIRRLRLLRELKIRGTLAAVAEALNQSPSSVSQQLTRLEKEVGVPLLRKSGRRLLLTPQAEILVDHTAHVLERLELAESEVNASFTFATGVIRIAVFQTAALALMPDALTTLAEEQPQLRVEMAQREPETALYNTWVRDFDLVIAEQYPGHGAPRYPELDRVLLAADFIRLAVPPFASGRASARIGSIQEAASAAWVMEPRGAASRHWAEQTCRSAGFEPDVRYETADLQAHVKLIESGNAIGLMPDLVWIGRETTVRLIDLPGNPQRRIFTSARRASAKGPAMIACRSSLAHAVASLGPAIAAG
jgi:DNA-binding transcriptional LysR family regulator